MPATRLATLLRSIARYIHVISLFVADGLDDGIAISDLGGCSVELNLMKQIHLIPPQSSELVTSLQIPLNEQNRWALCTRSHSLACEESPS